VAYFSYCPMTHQPPSSLVLPDSPKYLRIGIPTHESAYVLSGYEHTNLRMFCTVIVYGDCDTCASGGCPRSKDTSANVQYHHTNTVYILYICAPAHREGVLAPVAQTPTNPRQSPPAAVERLVPARRATSTWVAPVAQAPVVIGRGIGHSCPHRKVRHRILMPGLVQRPTHISRPGNRSGRLVCDRADNLSMGRSHLVHRGCPTHLHTYPQVTPVR
jgi:hypothetical protein